MYGLAITAEAQCEATQRVMQSIGKVQPRKHAVGQQQQIRIVPFGNMAPGMKLLIEQDRQVT